MRLLIPCMHCLQELGRPDEWFARVEFRDDGRFEVQCRRGHRSVTILQQPKFEVLFEIGVNAIIDGYYREAIASFAASLERFYEFASCVVLEDASVDRDLVGATWKLVATSSERQLGAFIFQWLTRFKETPAVLSNSQVALRNEVIHKGKIPSKEKAIEFGDAVLSVSFPKLCRMRQELQEALHKATFYTLKERRTPADASVQTTTLAITTAFSQPTQPSLEAYLSTVATRRSRVET